MKQVLAVRVGAKKAVGHIVSKRWWPTVVRKFPWLFCLARAWACVCVCVVFVVCFVGLGVGFLLWGKKKKMLTPRRKPVERRAPAAKSGADVVMDAEEESGSGAESGWSGVSDNSSTDSECTVLEALSMASDQNRFDTAYEAFRDLSAVLYDIDTTRYSRQRRCAWCQVDWWTGEVARISCLAIGLWRSWRSVLEGSRTPDRWLRCHRSCSWAVLAWAHRGLSSTSIYRNSACCQCHLVDGSTGRKRRPS